MGTATVFRWGDDLIVAVRDTGEIGQFAAKGSWTRIEVEEALKAFALDLNCGGRRIFSEPHKGKLTRFRERYELSNGLGPTFPQRLRARG